MQDCARIEHRGAWAQATCRDLASAAMAVRREWLRAKGAIDGLAELGDADDEEEYVDRGA